MRWRSFQAVHGIGALFEPRGTPLFDGYGLRQHVLDCIIHDEDQARRDKRPSYRIKGSVPTRQALATVLDEEEGYRWLLAYMAYRHGFRVYAIAFWQEAIHLLGPAGRLDRPTTEIDPSHNYMLSLEDWFLSYPDQNKPGMSDLRRRSVVLPALRLKAPPLRRFLTVGHQHQSGVLVDRRERLLAEVRDWEFAYSGHPLKRSQQLSFKPASGLYTLWKELALDRDWNTFDGPAWDERKRTMHHGLAPGFFWPPDNSDRIWEQDVDDGHSSPGRLLHIAEHLVDRANKFIKEVNTPTEALRGAVLATQALELLGSKTPTVSVEALLLKHAFEVIAECQFPGVEYHLNIKERLADIRANLAAMSSWLHEKRRQDFLLNAEAQILSKLTAILEEYGEYEEAELCQDDLRDLHRQISVRYDFRTRPLLAPLIWPFRWYIVFVLRSSFNFILSITVLLLVFWGFHYVDKTYGGHSKSSSSSADISSSKTKDSSTNSEAQPLPKEDTFYDAYKAIISGEPVDKTEDSLVTKLISYAAALLGVLNLGILISVLHSRMNRR
jgi:hypothetical protein